MCVVKKQPIDAAAAKRQSAAHRLISPTLPLRDLMLKPRRAKAPMHLRQNASECTIPCAGLTRPRAPFPLLLIYAALLTAVLQR